jgi:uncharacterized protein (TIGR03000 family)
VGYTSYYTSYSGSCCTVGCGSCCSSGCGWYLGYRPGPIRRLLFGPYRWYYGCGSSCYLDTCCSSVVMIGSTSPTEAQKPAMPVEPAEPAGSLPGPLYGPEPALEPPLNGSGSLLDSGAAEDTSGVLTIYVPEDAKVQINGYLTRSEGVRRQYISHGLKPGFSYKYEIRAEVLRRGETLTTTRTVVLKAGDVRAVALDFDASVVEGLASR